jgi:hypothetical protein
MRRYVRFLALATVIGVVGCSADVTNKPSETTPEQQKAAQDGMKGMMEKKGKKP